jgi:hypothetical protein
LNDREIKFLASESELIRTSAASGVTIGLADIANGFLTHQIPFRDEEITEIYGIQIAYVVTSKSSRVFLIENHSTKTQLDTAIL